VLHVLGADELAPDLEGVERVIDSETGEQLLIREGKDAAKAYKAALAAWLESVETRCRALGIQYVRADVSEAVRSFVEGTLYRGQVVEHAGGGVQ
jgi:hypothetical protein